ncbi:hypothetical protein ILP92_11830 [Maribius pontilimi]|uniref:SGNH hydrolase-type esterase domain-containing protein n=1 Tax=Palleronia pontilimi TaxID=1964209 RepID=A0A934IHF6_9RHOB|nr:GDSL-type esterase/lipase family protein [Palleronia pontilimi]MBJ3763435.1 hypothetical protein [Palleronia pontilimi]
MTHLLVYGDSNSHGSLPRSAWGDLPRMDDATRWPGQLAAALGQGWKVTVEALPGRTIALDDPGHGEWRNGLRVLPAALLSHAPIDIVAIMLGTNDLQSKYGMRALDVADNARRMLREVTVHMPGATRLLIAPPPPVAAGLYVDFYHDAQARGAGLAAHMGRVAAEEGCAFFDAGGVVSVDPEDGVHLRPPAHAALARALTPVIRGLA